MLIVAICGNECIFDTVFDFDHFLLRFLGFRKRRALWIFLLLVAILGILSTCKIPIHLFSEGTSSELENLDLRNDNDFTQKLVHSDSSLDSHREHLLKNDIRKR